MVEPRAAESAPPALSTTAARAGADPDDPPLIGRDAAMARVGELLDDLPEHGGALLAVGPIGSGKTALLDRAVHAMHRRGVQVVRVAGVRQESQLPDALLERLLPLLPGAPPGPVRATAEAVATAVRAATRSAPLVLVVDDLHHVDRPSTQLLRRLVEAGSAAEPDGGRLGLLASARDAGAAAWAPAVELTPLPDGAARALVRRHHPALPAAVVDRLVTEAEGNPLLLVELPALLTPEQTSGQAELPALLPLSSRLAAVFGPQIARLPDSTRSLLLRVALDVPARPMAGEGRAPDRDQDRDGDQDQDWDLDLAEARAGGLVRVDPRGRLRFTHPLGRLSVLASSTGSERRRAHRELADRDPDEARHAWHLAAASLHPDVEVAARLARAAQVHLSRGEVTSAVAALVRSADLSPSPAARSRSLAHAAYVTAVSVGALDETAELLTRAREAAGPELPLWGFLAEAQRLLHVSGDVDAAQRSVSAALSRMDPADRADPQALARALREEVTIDVLAMRPLSADVVDGATAADTPEARSLRLLAAVADPAGVGPPDPAAFEEALEQLAEETDATVIGQVAGAALFVDRIADCRPALLRLESGHGHPDGATVTASMLLAMDDYLAGRWSQVARRCAEGLAFAEPHADQLLQAQFHCLLGLLAAARGDTRSVRRLCGEVESWAVPQGVGALVTWCRQVRSLDAMGRADHESAFQHALAVATARPGSGGRAQATWNSLDLVESALRTGRQEVAAAHVEAALEDPLTPLSPRAAAVLPACLAMTAAGDRAAGFFSDALAAPSLAGFPFEHARIRLLHGEWLRRARARREARAELALAVDLFTALGARPWVQRAEVELAATGVPPPRESPAPPDGLTAQQRQVAHLAASGLTNLQIAARLGVSRRTVATHLSGAFRTLDVSSRAALRDALGPLPATSVPPGSTGRDPR